MRKGEHRWLLALIAFALCGIVVLSDAGRYEPTSPSSKPSSTHVSLGQTSSARPTKLSSVAVKKPASKPSRGAAWVETVRRCILHRESRGNYRIRSRTTDPDGRYAYGGFQFQDPTFRAVTGLRGHASDYSPAVQDAAFIKLFDNGRGRSHWYLKGGPQCW